jgi:hypothetical protein
MALARTPGTELELQAIADICFSAVECYTTKGSFTPAKVIYPLRFSTVAKPTRCMRLWVQPGHCMALVAPNAQPHLHNILDESHLLQAVPDRVREEKSHEEADSGFAKIVADIYTRFMRQDNLNEESGLAIGSAGEISYKKEMDSIRKVEKKSDAQKQKKRKRFHRCEHKLIPEQQ